MKVRRSFGKGDALIQFRRATPRLAVDRRFNRARYDADAIVAAFVASLRDAIGLDRVHQDVLDVVQRSVDPEYALIWTQPPVDRPSSALRRHTGAG